MAVLSVLALIPRVLIGFLISHLIWDEKSPVALGIKFFVGVGLGMGLSSSMFFIWIWLNFEPSTFIVIEIMLLFIISFIVWRRYKKEINISKLHFVKFGTIRILFLSLLFFSVSASFVKYLMQALQIPHGYEDAWSIWNLTARYIFGSPQQYFSYYLGESLWSHPDYPLLLSANIAETWFYLRNASTRVPMMIAASFMVSTVFLMFFGLTKIKDFEQASLGTLLLASLPITGFMASIQYADLPIAYFFLATIVLLSTYFSEKNINLLVLAGAMAGFSAWTKNEGILFVVACLLTIGFYCIWHKKNFILWFVYGVFLPLIVVVSFKIFLAPPNDLFIDHSNITSKLLDFSRYFYIIKNIYMKVMTFDGFIISLPIVLLMYGGLMWSSRDVPKEQASLFLLVILQFSGYFVIYLITPHDLDWHLYTSLDRLLYHLLPMTLFIYFSIIMSPSKLLYKKEAI